MGRSCQGLLLCVNTELLMTTSSAGDLEYQKVNKKIGKELSFAFI